MKLEQMHLETQLIHAGQENKGEWGSLATPIYQTSTFCFDTVDDAVAVDLGQKKGYMYTRASNPTLDVLIEKVRVLEGGEAAICTSSGMGAIGSTMVGLLETGDHVVCSDTVYGGTDFVMRSNMPRLGIGVSFTDTTDLDAIRAAIRPNTKMIYLESVTNPTMKLADIRAIAELAHARGIKVVVDNTFAPPPIMHPLAMGADVVLHSATKYINGHGDVLAGVAVGGKEDIANIKLRGMKMFCGSPITPFAAYLIIRGMKTMDLRVRQHCANALALAQYLETRPEISRVFYPGLESHPQHALAVREMNGLYTGMIAFEVREGYKGYSSFDAVKKLLDNLKLIAIAVSLGDPDSLIEHAATMTHDEVPKATRDALGITDGLVRFSVGLENKDDLIADFEQAFQAF